ncbi:NAD(P)H-dependent oxidoreductase [Paenibacillus glucanolyticus]|uniref:NAD(P)H-dependent oxidoreductase n=1 Tax=Paenibacillus glucanolyticus TaxID=59843 RepID=UPI00096C6A6D|nr:NAD(P)H-dependent oxidoreductase [Paenibacillus glucanolyticus]OMF71432.1 general stress protein [Paenibacillus glucanolyticus]
MRTLVIVAHPSLQTGSRINRELTETVRSMEDVMVHDLYQQYPDGCIDIAAEQQLLLRHDRIVFQFPFWWYSSPPLLKHWFDQVLTFGWAYGPGGDKLRGKEWDVAVTTGGAEEAYGSGGYNRYTVEELTRPYEVTASLVGAAYLPVFTVHNAMQLTDEELRRYAEDFAQHVTNVVRSR